jgi:hypothetical protein
MAVGFETVERLLHDATDGHAVPRAKSTARTAITGFEWMFVLTGGLAIALPILFYLGETRLGSSNEILWYFWINTIVSSPHVYATFVRLQRKISTGKTSWWLGWPLYLAMVFGLGLLTFTGFFVEAMTAVNVWQSWHYVRQTYGISCLYGTQDQFTDSDRRLRWWAYHLVFPLLIFGRMDQLYTVWAGASSPHIIPFAIGIWMSPLWFLAYAGIYIAIMAEVRLYLRNRQNYNPMGLICYLLCIGVHYYGFMVESHYQRGFFAVTIFHATQYLALVWFMERKTAPQSARMWLQRVPNLLGFMLFWAVLYLIAYGYEQNLVTWVSNVSWPQFGTVLMAGISVHHYIVDSFIWRRSVGA